MSDEHPVYRAQFYIQELKEYVSWSEYLKFYKEQDENMMNFTTFCMQMWSSYMTDRKKQKESPLSYQEYCTKYKQLLEEGYNARPED